MVTAEIVGAILHDVPIVAPIGIRHQERFDVTLSLPVILGKEGFSRVLMPDLSPDEDRALEASAQAIKAALDELPSDLRP